MRRLAVALVGTSLVAACEQDPARVQARGGGVSAALEVIATAATITQNNAERPASRCRAFELPEGPVTIDIRITLALKHAASGAGAQQFVGQWRRDEAGDVAFRRELLTRLPDGRPVLRSVETRRVDGRYFRALDDRYVEADRVPRIADELDDAAFADIDGMLSLIDRAQSTWLSALPGRGLCRGEGALGLPAPRSAEVVWAADGRSGDIVWEMDGTTLVAEFSEALTSGAADVTAPTEVFAIDPDPTWSELRTFVEQGRREGWLEAGRTFGDWTALGGSGEL